MGHVQSGKCLQITLPSATPLPLGGSRIAVLPVVEGALLCLQTLRLGVGMRGMTELELVQVRASRGRTELV